MTEDWYQQLPLEDITNIEQTTGGDVNQAYKVTTIEKAYFLLIQPNREVDFYDNEIASLQAISAAGIAVPKVISSGQINGDAYLLLSFLEAASGSQADLAKDFAKLHTYKSQNGQFGFDTPHQGSAISFDNSWTDSWPELFIERRLDKLRDALVENGYWDDHKLAEYETARNIM